jgi:hypothetical protein
VCGIAVITYAWQLGLAAHLAATLTIMAAYLAGAAIADVPGWLSVVPVQLWMEIEAAPSRAIYVLVRNGPARPTPPTRAAACRGRSSSG